MAQAYVDSVKKKFKIEEINREKVKRRLFCDEEVPKIDEPVAKRSTTPLSYSQNKSVFFLRAKKYPEFNNFFCITCFEETYRIDTDIHTEYLYVNEIPLNGFSYQATIRDYCCACQKKLYSIVYPGETAKF